MNTNTDIPLHEYIDPDTPRLLMHLDRPPDPPPSPPPDDQVVPDVDNGDTIVPDKNSAGTVKRMSIDREAGLSQDVFHNLPLIETENQVTASYNLGSIGFDDVLQI
jgi:hypothetical protein